MNPIITEPEMLNARILIIDDEKGNIQVLERLLKAMGLNNIRSITDGRLAVELYREFQPDLVMLDLKMPQCDGFEVMARLKRDIKEDYLPILILTAQRDQETRLRALQSGGKDFLNKPFEIAEGLTRIRNLLEVRLLHNQIRDHNRLLEEKVLERTSELEKARVEVILRLGRAAEFRDNETGMHVFRMSRLCARLARAIGLTDPECQVIQYASPMHDVGKIGIPDYILLKKARLTDEEWAIMKTHPQIGAQILSGSTSVLMKMAETMALTHHERWDGSGYPQGLKGDEIPLAGRIVSVSDVFDALTSERPYKPAWEPAEALEEMVKASGEHFDPQLMKAFQDHFGDMVEIVRKYADIAPTPQTGDYFPKAPLDIISRIV